MRRFWIPLLALLLTWPWPAFSTEAPFAPVPDVPDYVATAVAKPGWGSPRREHFSVAHHAGWSRADGAPDNRDRSQNYFGPGPLSITIWRNPSGAYSSLQILRGAERHRTVGWDHQPFKTGERDTWLGEDCDIWNVARTITDGRGITRLELKKLGCISRDGIELWRRYANKNGDGSSAETVSIERRPVAAAEVQPPADLLDLKSWVPMPDRPAARPSGAPGDVTVVMKKERLAPSGRPMLTRIVRRHHPWTYTDDVDGNGRRHVTIDNELERLKIIFEQDAAGMATRLTMMKSLPPKPGDRQMTPVNLGRTERILGEQCTWFNMWPGMMDAGLEQCRTADGVVLKEHRSSRMEIEPLVAVVLGRSALGLAQVLPPPDILRRATWGIPD